MSWTRKQFVDQAFGSIGIAAYSYDLSPDQRQDAVRLMDSMMATWDGKGIHLGYPLPTNPDVSDLAFDTGVPDKANEAIYTNLALRIAPGFGKTPSVELKQAAKAAYDALLLEAAFPPEMQLPGGMPLGAGNRSMGGMGAFTPAPNTGPLQVAPNGQLVFVEP